MISIFLIYLAFVVATSVVVLNLVFKILREADYACNIFFIINTVLGILFLSLFIALPTMVVLSVPSNDFEARLKSKLLIILENRT